MCMYVYILLYILGIIYSEENTHKISPYYWLMNNCVFCVFPIVATWPSSVLSTRTLPSIHDPVLLSDCALLVSISCLCQSVLPVNETVSFCMNSAFQVHTERNLLHKVFPSLICKLFSSEDLFSSVCIYFREVLIVHLINSFVVLLDSVHSSPLHHHTGRFKGRDCVLNI